jgi:hypothetical protein
MISLEACLTQLFFVIFFGVSEFFLLTAMSYDRYVAICKPLHYTNIMSSRLCIQLVAACYMTALLTISLGLIMGLGLEYCGAIIEHFFCDYSLLKLSCMDTAVIDLSIISHHYTPEYLDTGTVLLCKHHKNNSEDPFCPAEEEGLFYLLFPHDCCLHLLWQLYFYVH